MTGVQQNIRYIKGIETGLSTTSKRVVGCKLSRSTPLIAGPTHRPWHPGVRARSRVPEREINPHGNRISMGCQTGREDGPTAVLLRPFMSDETHHCSINLLYSEKSAFDEPLKAKAMMICQYLEAKHTQLLNWDELHVHGKE
jgi:hypothetical protein